jgi:hypothetical protein
MANMKPFLPILTSVSISLLLFALQIHAEDSDESKSMPAPLIVKNEEQAETSVSQNPFTFDYLIGFPSDNFGRLVIGYGRLGFGYKPLEGSELLINVGLEHFFNQNNELNNLDFETKFMNLRWSIGYKFDVGNDFSITPALGLATDLTEFDSSTTQAYTNVRFEYDMTDTFGLFIEGIYDFESNILPENETIGFGFKYTPNYSQPTINLVNAESIPLPFSKLLVSDFGATAPLLKNNAEDFVKSNGYKNMRFTIQIGAFSSMSAAINAYSKQKLINIDDTYIVELNGLFKIYYKGYNNFDLANKALANLKGKGVDSFLLNTPYIIWDKKQFKH